VRAYKGFLDELQQVLTFGILEIMTKWVELWCLVLLVFGICYRYMLITVILGINSNLTEGKINVSYCMVGGVCNKIYCQQSWLFSLSFN